MKKITIPAPIHVEKLGKEIPFQDFAGMLLRDQKFAADMGSVLAAVSIQKHLSEASLQLLLDDSEHKLLVAVAEAPTGGYNPQVAMELAPFMLAIKNAETA